MPYAQERRARRAAEGGHSVAATFEIYEDQSGTWRWKLFAGNKTQIAASGDPHPTRSSAESAVKAVKRDAANATVTVSG